MLILSALSVTPDSITPLESFFTHALILAETPSIPAVSVVVASLSEALFIRLVCDTIWSSLFIIAFIISDSETVLPSSNFSTLPCRPQTVSNA